jgi:sugar lactone lactonase YvrE
LVLFFAPAAHAQLRDWTNYTDVNDVNAITSYGDTIWLATNGGLVRFLESDPSNEVRLTNADGLGDNQLRFVTIDSNGVLWCGGENGRLSRRRHDKSWSVYTFEDENGLPIRLNAAAAGPDGFLWVASDKGVHKFDTERNGGEIKESYTRIGDWPDESAARDIEVTTLWVWVVGPAGIARASLDDQFLLDRAHWRSAFNVSLSSLVVTYTFETFTQLYVGGPTGLQIVFADSLWGIGRDANDPVFDNINDLALCRSSNKDTLWVAFDDGPGVLRDGVDRMQIPGATLTGFTSVHCTGNAVYFGQADGGVWRLMNDTWTHIELNGPLDNNLADIAVDDRGRVWTAHTDRGASFLDEDGAWQSPDYIIAGPGGPMNAVDVAPDGDVWFGIFGGGVWQVDGDDPLNANAATNFKKPNSSLMWVQNPSRPQDFEYVVVQDVVVDRQGRVWAANAFADSGAVIAWNDHDCWGRFDAFDGITSNSPIAIYPLDSSVLVGFGNIGVMEINFREPLCSGGQAVNQIPRLAQRTTADGLPSDLVTALLYDNSDSLWVGTNLGLARYARDRRRFFKIDMPPEAGLTVNALAVDANNSLWIGTSLGLVLRDADGTMTFFNSRNSGLVGDHVAEIDIDDNTGDVWIATHSGISQTRGPLPASTDIESIVAYPNPFEIGEVDRVRFNAESGSRITITTVSGHQVASIDSDTGWDGRNAAGELVATGVYLFVARSPAGDYGTGKIAVIRR